MLLKKINLSAFIFIFLGIGIFSLSVVTPPLVEAASFGSSQLPNKTCTDPTDPQTCEATNTINKVLNFLAALIIPVITVMIIIGGIQYSIAGNNPEAIKKARYRIYKAVFALVIFISLWSFLKWLIPGGLE